MSVLLFNIQQLVMKISNLISGSVLLITMIAGTAPAQTQGTPQLDRDLLSASIESGRKFLLNNQKEDGSFTYEYNFVRDHYPAGDSEVRQAGALWGLALLHSDDPRAETRDALIRGADFFLRNSKKCTDGSMYIIYPGESSSTTGTLALVTLSLVDWLSVEDDKKLIDKYKPVLDRYIRFLLKLRNDEMRFYTRNTGCKNKSGSPSPYYDGESLLALVKAAKYMGYAKLREELIESADAMYEEYVVRARNQDADSPVTKGFYQWGSMAFHEMYTAGWGDKYAGWTIDLAYWMIDTHHVLRRNRNTGYAFEGLSVAWECARLTGNQEAMAKIEKVIREGLYKLISWQVGAPNEVDFLKRKAPGREKALGGVMNGAADPVLRIDVTQHQMHANLLARRFLFAGRPAQFGVKPANPASDSITYSYFTPAKLHGMVRSGADFLLRMQEADGRYNYYYDPSTGKSSTSDEDNFLRQAGTALSVLTVFEMTGDSVYYRSVLKSLDNLLQYRMDLDNDKSYFLFNEKAKLGGVALPMLVMLKLKVITRTREYDDLIGRLGNMIIYLQEIYDKGGMYKSTYVYRGDFNHEVNTNWESNIYPGEALYALSYAYGLYKKEEYRRSVDLALDAYRTSRFWTNGAFIPWTLYALAEMYNSTGEEKYTSDAFQLADFLLTSQNMDPKQDIFGSFYRSPTVGSASNLEGIGNAVYLAKKIGDSNRFRKYSNRMMMGMYWLERLQVSDKTGSRKGITDLHYGGLMYSLKDPTLRIDNTQHAISAIMQVLRYIY
jgi:hypothetical protein